MAMPLTAYIFVEDSSAMAKNRSPYISRTCWPLLIMPRRLEYRAARPYTARCVFPVAAPQCRPTNTVAFVGWRRHATPETANAVQHADAHFSSGDEVSQRYRPTVSIPMNTEMAHTNRRSPFSLNAGRTAGTYSSRTLRLLAEAVLNAIRAVRLNG